MYTGKEWSLESIERLRALWNEGHSTTEIGHRLGYSKNAIVGKAHRLDLPSRPSPIRPASEERPRRVRAKRTVPKLAEIMPLRSLPAVMPARLVIQRGLAEPPKAQQLPPAVGHAQCAWPIGAPGARGFHFCCDFALVGKPYCEEHCKLAYVRWETRDNQQQENAARL